MKLRFLFVAILVCLAGMVFADALSDYVAKDDGAYSVKLSKIQLNSSQNVSVATIDLTSQIWQDNKFNHNVELYYPNGALVTNTALMVVTRGETNSDWKQSMAYLAQMMLCPVVVVYVHPIDISGVYDNIFETIITDKEKAKCPIIYADAKTIVKAMDAIGEITHETYNNTIDDFVIAGCEGAALPVWYAASLGDNRVRAIIPMGLCMVNMTKQIPNAKNNLESINSKLNVFIKYGEQLTDFDPYTYIDKVTCPKLIMLGSNGDMLGADSPKFYFKDLKGTQNYLFYDLNEDDDIWFTQNSTKYAKVNSYANIITTMRAFFYKVTKDQDFESCSFDWTNSGDTYTLNINCPVNKVVYAYYYEADSPTSDFTSTRWNKKTLEKKGGVYSLTTEKPAHGNRCAFVELVFTSPVGGNYSEFSIPCIIGQN